MPDAAAVAEFKAQMLAPDATSIEAGLEEPDAPPPPPSAAEAEQAWAELQAEVPGIERHSEAMNELVVWEKYVPANVASQLPANKRAKVTKKEVRLLSSVELEAILSELEDVSYYGPVFLAAWTGFRLSENTGLVWGDVNLRDGNLTVRLQLSRDTTKRVETKNGVIRTVHLSPKVVAFLKRHREAAMARGRHRDSDYVFVTRTGTPIRSANLGEPSEMRRSGLTFLTSSFTGSDTASRPSSSRAAAMLPTWPSSLATRSR
jgi:integrase